MRTSARHREQVLQSWDERRRQLYQANLLRLQVHTVRPAAARQLQVLHEVDRALHARLERGTPHGRAGGVALVASRRACLRELCAAMRTRRLSLVAASHDLPRAVAVALVEAPVALVVDVPRAPDRAHLLEQLALLAPDVPLVVGSPCLPVHVSSGSTREVHRTLLDAAQQWTTGTSDALVDLRA